MARKYKRKYHYSIARPIKSVKYSNESFATRFNLGYLDAPGPALHKTETLVVVPSVSAPLGTRKVKNFTVSFICDHSRIFRPNADELERPAQILWALVFVPEGTNASEINPTTTLMQPRSLYEPNQNVIMAGLITSQNMCRFKTRLARNLNAGDSIQMVLYNQLETGAAGDELLSYVNVHWNFAISY